MPERKPSLTVYLDQKLKDELAEIREHLRETSGFTWSTTQIGEFAVRELVKRYREGGDQLTLDFSPGDRLTRGKR